MNRSAIIPCLVVNLLFIPHVSEGQNSEEEIPCRQPAVAGSFYSSDPLELKAQLSEFFQEAESGTANQHVAALIAPHAGYVFSGKVAASAYAQLNKEQSYDRVFLLGTSHHVYLKGASIYNHGNYKTPLGKVEVDLDLANELIGKYPFFEYVPEAHTQEHSLEVQLPFLQYRLHKHFKIIPIIIGTQSAATCKEIAEALKPYFTSRNLFVISSDFSHYPDYEGARNADHDTGAAIASNSPEAFLKALKDNESKRIPGLATSACGWSSILTLLNLSSEVSGMKVKDVRYQNSGDSRYGDKQRVVGYHAFAFNRSGESVEGDEISLSDEEKISLLRLARQSIESHLIDGSDPKVDEAELPQSLKIRCGAFVTLRKKGKLRGCVGHLQPDNPLYQIVPEMAWAAAFWDSRFDPVGWNELDDIDIEISVLTPLKRIHSIEEFELGKHGIYMVKGKYRGTLLPQVAESTHWSKNEFLEHCAADKAGIGKNGWQNADLYTYRAFVFSEQEILQLHQ
ncbi:AmmeMemoRadiSam system protein B [Mangrovibacterium lignilyticum]|uniref:AmmeMemoRadiSam system protein B n=1 Tax=Mangrovibacterium lignilyticum TaxID=2668052 RepID=UPI0013D55024|nr:AmmeMemoRadiSam system protein B [Mangrovibacterium lignilyticum]